MSAYFDVVDVAALKVELLAVVDGQLPELANVPAFVLQGGFARLQLIENGAKL